MPMTTRVFSDDEFELMQDLIRFACLSDFFDPVCLDEEDEDDVKKIEKLKNQKLLFPYVAAMFHVEDSDEVKEALGEN
jgi:hypothetical protein